MLYAAFLRGINVGGRSLIKMTDLKGICESAGMTDVQTILASGNVLFGSTIKGADAIERKLERALKKRYKRDIPVFVRTIDELRRMHRDQPFKNVKVTGNTRLYVTFLSENSQGLKLPEMPADLRITRIKDDAVFCVLELSPRLKTTDSMNIIQKAFGPRITTRNWNTIQKLLKAAV